MEHPVDGDATLVSGEVAAVASHLAESTPQSIGRYRIERVLGAGGMGVVYMARDPALDRRVAVKRMRDREEVEDAERIQHEARSAAAVVHPNVVTIYDVGTDGGRVFVAMEYVEGESLTRWIRRRRSWREVLAMLLQAGRALAAAHAAGIVHRDFKPDNVLIGESPLGVGEHPSASGRVAAVKVVDFGLAAALADSDALDDGTAPQPLDVQATSRWIGTPAYMAPERHDGARGDAKSDQFAFAVVAFECLWRTRPFAGLSAAEVSASICDGRIERPPRSAVPRSIERAVVRALSRAPSGRFATMDELVDALAGAGRTRTRIGGAMLVAATLGVAATVVGMRRETACDGGETHVRAVWNDETRDRLLARWGRDAEGQVPEAVVGIDGWVEAWRQAHAHACEEGRDGDVDVLDRRMACLQRRLASARATIDVVAEHSRASPSADPLVRAMPDPSTCLADDEDAPGDAAHAAELAELDADLARAHALWFLGLFAAAEPIADGLLARAEAVGGSSEWRRAAILRANLWLAVGRIDEAVALVDVVYDRALAEGDDRGAMTAIQLQATAAQMREDGRAMLHWARRAEIQAARMESARPGFTAMISLMMANGHRLSGDLVTALAYHRAAVDTVETNGLDGYIAVFVNAELAYVFVDLGRLDEAQVRFDRAQQYAAALPLNSSDPLALDHGRASLHIAQRRPDLALTMLLRTRARLAKIDQLDTEVARKVTCTMAEALYELEDVEAALREGESCLAGYLERESEGPASARAMVRWARSAIVAGRVDEGITRVERALALIEHELGADHRDAAAALLVRSLGARARGDAVRAEADEQRTLEIVARPGGSVLLQLVALLRFGRAALERGELERARSLLQRAHEIGGDAEGPDGPDTVLAEALLLAARWESGEHDADLRVRASAVRERLAHLTGRDPGAARAALDRLIRPGGP